MAESNANGNDSELNALEQHIIKLIPRIKKNRARPCFQNLLSYLHREGKELGMEDLKVVIDNMLTNNLIVNIGKEDVESFILNQESLSEYVDDGVNDKTVNEDDDDVKALESFIDDSVKNTLHEKIKTEVKKEFHEISTLHKPNDLLNSDINLTSSNKNQQANRKDYTDELITSLKADIEFLRKELLSKDSIIKLLINDRNNSIDLKSKETANDISANDYSKRSKKLLNSTRKKTDVVSNKKSSDDSKSDDFKSQKKVNSNIRTISIIGDSMLKDIKGYEMKKDLPKNTKVFVRPNSGANTEDMIDYVRPTKKHNPDLFILHCGTNDLRTGKEPSAIANEIVQLALDVKLDENEVAISSIITRNDELNNKALQVNDFLKIKAKMYNLGFIEHTNISKNHLNNSKLHLNQSGAQILSKNLVEFINY